MSLSITTRRVDYVGNAANSVYAYTFRVFAQADLQVRVVNTTTGVIATLTLTTDYTVSGVGSSSGGNVTLVNSAQAWLTAGNLSTGYNISIRRVVTLVQNTDIRNQGSFLPETHENAFDYVTMIVQQQQDDLDRSVRLPDVIPATSFDPTLPSTITLNPGAPFIVNPSGTGLVMGAPYSGVPLYYIQSTRPADPPAGILAFWDDTTVGASKKWSPFTGDYEVITG